MNVTDRLSAAVVAAWCGAGCAEMDAVTAAGAYTAAAVWWTVTGLVAAVGWDTIRRARGGGQ